MVHRHHPTAAHQLMYYGISEYGNYKTSILKVLGLEIASSRHNISRVEELMLKVNDEFRLPLEEFQKLMIAVTEVVINAIIHGNKEDKNKKVTIAAEYDDRNLFVKIYDEGNGFNPIEIADPTLPENLLKESGRGIFIVKSLVDDFSYRHTEKGSEFVLAVRKK